MSLFDLIYFVLDRPHENLYRKFANHIVSLFYDEEVREEQSRRDEANGEISLIRMTQNELMEYKSYSRRHIQHKISNEAAEKLIEGYDEMRSLGLVQGGNVTKTITKI
eukprot:223243_1